MRLFSRNRRSATRGATGPEDVLRILSGYILHMSITSLDGGDVVPLYEEYLGDRRLGATELQELTNAFQTLRSAKAGLSANT